MKKLNLNNNKITYNVDFTIYMLCPHCNHKSHINFTYNGEYWIGKCEYFDYSSVNQFYIEKKLGFQLLNERLTEMKEEVY